MIAFAALWLYTGWLFFDSSASPIPGQKTGLVWAYPLWMGVLVILLWPIMVPLATRALRRKMRKS